MARIDAAPTPPPAGCTVLWRRLDEPGHDVARIERRGAGWRLHGTAVFRQGGAPCALTYRVDSDAGWRTQRAAVDGRVGGRVVQLRVRRARDGTWRCGDRVVRGLGDCATVDFGFTPATNLLQLQHARLAIGSSAAAPVAWTDVKLRTLVRLPQHYTRRDAFTYRYEAPTVGYTGLLRIGVDGFVRSYPRLWRAES
jgi:hypothetical protein